MEHTIAAKLRMSPKLLQRLGEELNPTIDQSILELVKNSHDADARECSVDLKHVESQGGVIEISDNGVGMTVGQIMDGWLLLGDSSKNKTPTKLGRIPVGNKGLGRLAALRMGRTIIVKTRPQDEPRKEYMLEIDWSKFDSATAVDDVQLNIIERERLKPYQGTDITIQGVQTKITHGDVKRLSRAMMLLSSPFDEEAKGFKPTLVANEFDDLVKLVQAGYLSFADYRLCAQLKDGLIMEARVTDWQGKDLFVGNHELVRQSPGRYEAPDARFDLWVFLQSRDSFSIRALNRKDIKSWIAQFGGVHLYENGIRVAPYGNEGNDWLDMNLRRVRSPEERPSTNNSVGRVSVSINSKDGLQLVQKTDRSGYIESEAFLELRLFAQHTLDWMAKERLQAAQERREKQRQLAPSKTERAKKAVEAVLKDLPPESRGKLQEVFETYEKTNQKEVKTLRRDLQLYRTLSTAGITAATFAHESHSSPLKTISLSTKVLDSKIKRDLPILYVTDYKPPLDRIRQATRSLSVLSDTTLSLLNSEKRRPRRVNVYDTMRSVVELFNPFLEERSVCIELKLAPGNPYLYTSEAAFESVFTNLINNSLAAFERAHSENRLIEMKTDIEGKSLLIRVEDSGPGLELPKKQIWLPGVTTQPNGTGLGLTIVRDAVVDMGGTVDAEEKSELGGAAILINIPILGS